MQDISSDDISAEALEAQRAIVEQSTDVRLPVIDREKMAFPGADERSVLRLFRGLEWSPDRDATELEVAVFDQFITLLPMLGLVPETNDEDTAEFHWARVSVLIAGLGYKQHAHMARRLEQMYPACPLDPHEAFKDWEKRVHKAHGLCGWPVTLAWVDWSMIVNECPEVDRETLDALPFWSRSWMGAVALFHLLKHLRHDQRGHAVAIYKGVVTAAGYEPGTNMIGEMRRLRASISGTLCLPRTDLRSKTVHPLGVAMRRILDQLPLSALMRRTSLQLLPGTVLANTWTRLAPYPDHMQPGQFARTGVRLINCWLAQDGTVSEIPGGHDEILTYAWNTDAATDEDDRAVRAFRAAVPAQYDSAHSPAEILCTAFPNVNFDAWQGEHDALFSAIDALVCLGLLRGEILGADREMPMFVALPTDPTPDGSTNQGKTTFAHCIARAITPDIPCSMAKDEDSAPASRSLAASIERFGSLCLDEYRPVRSKSHILAHASLQALCTGQSVNVGRVLSNAEAFVRLRHGICASAKCLVLPPDMVNRSLFMWLDTMGDEQRGNVAMAEAIAGGRVSIQMRLAGVSLIERLRLECAPAVASSHMRFPVLFGLMMEIHRHRTGRDAETCRHELEHMLDMMRDNLEAHYRLAEDTGLAAIQEDAVSIRVRTGVLFEDLTVDEMEQLEIAINARADNGGRFTPASMLKARGEIMEMGSSLSRIVSVLTGNRYTVSDRAVSLALSRDIQRLMPRVGDTWRLPGLVGLAGWYLERVSDAGKSTVRLVIRRSVSESSGSLGLL